VQRLWLITNPASGSTSDAKAEAIAAACVERDLAIVGTTRFPEQSLPSRDDLAGANADTVMLFAGDGTVNAALCAYADWHGQVLVLPGGTMNMLAKVLHESLDPATIIHAAHERLRCTTLPYVEAGPHRAFVGVILGPAAAWARARERLRVGWSRGILRAVRAAWHRTLGEGIRVRGAGLRQRYQAVFVTPVGDEGRLSVAGVDARDIRSLADLGWAWMTGDWLSARAVEATTTDEFTTAGRRPVTALFDGESAVLEPGTRVFAGASRRMFLTTRESA
jgi:diacylglycerol kinase family enzyme